MLNSGASRRGTSRLTGGSRSRRRIAMSHYHEQPVGEIEALSGEHAGEPVRELSVAGIQESPAAGKARSAGFLAVQQRLDGADQLTWLFAGDRLVDAAVQPQRWRSSSEYFADWVRRDLNRPLDLLVDLTLPGETSGELRKRLEMSLLRLNADVVSVTLGFADAQDGPRGLAIFLHNLKQIVALIRSEGAVPLLQTPHRVGSMQAAFQSALLPYARAIRETARELDVACVNHWGRWRRVERSRGSLRRWLDPEEMYPSPRGHAAMARLLSTKIGR